MLSYVYFCHEEIISIKIILEKTQIVNYSIERLGLYNNKKIIVKTIVKNIVGIHTGDFKTKRNNGSTKGEMTRQTD